MENSTELLLEISTDQNGNAENNKGEASSYVSRSGRVSKPPQRLNCDTFKDVCLPFCNYIFLMFTVKGDVVERTKCVLCN